MTNDATRANAQALPLNRRTALSATGAGIVTALLGSSSAIAAPSPVAAIAAEFMDAMHAYDAAERTCNAIRTELERHGLMAEWRIDRSRYPFYRMSPDFPTREQAMSYLDKMDAAYRRNQALPGMTQGLADVAELKREAQAHFDRQDKAAKAAGYDAAELTLDQALERLFAAHKALLDAPCTTFEEVKAKASCILAAAAIFSSLGELEYAEALRFMRSIVGEA